MNIPLGPGETSAVKAVCHIRPLLLSQGLVELSEGEQAVLIDPKAARDVLEVLSGLRTWRSGGPAWTLSVKIHQKIATFL